MRVRLKKFIENIKFKKHIKILLLVFVVVWMFSWYTFADGIVNSDVDEFVNVIYKALTFLSRWWVIFANLAGKLMTNDIVYGWFLHLDSTLWIFWNVIKNMANFLLGCLVLYAILRNLLSSVWKLQNDKWWPVNVIKNTLIAGVLIQMSRFLVWIVLDVSTVCTVAIGSFPAQFLASNNEFQRNFSKDLDKIVKNKAIINYKDINNPVSVTSVDGEEMDQDDVNSLIDTLLPSTDSLSGPLIYIWMIIFNFNDYSVKEVQDGDSWRELILSVWLSGILLLSYSIMMILMFIFNMMRVLVLWIAIPLMPLIIVASLFDFKLQNFFWEIIKIENLLKLVFKPVLLTWALSLVLIILVLIKWIINSDVSQVDLSDKNLVINSKKVDDVYNSEMNIDGLLDVNMNWFKDGFADIVVYILWLCLVYFVLKLATVKTGIWFIDKAMSGVFERVWKIITNTPIIPIPWWSPVSIESLRQELSTDTVLTRRLWISKEAQLSRMKKFLGTDEEQYYSSYSALNKSMSKDDFMRKAYDISIKQGVGTYDAISKNTLYNKALEDKRIEWNDGKTQGDQIGSVKEIFERNEKHNKENEEKSEKTN